jgi:hypothetical protein
VIIHAQGKVPDPALIGTEQKGHGLFWKVEVKVEVEAEKNRNPYHFRLQKLKT